MATKAKDSAIDHAGEAADGQERRRWQRVLVDLEVDYGDADNYLFAYIRDISATGIFVRTHQPEQPGTRLNLRFTPDGARHPFALEGEVIWWNPFRPGQPDNLHPGMGIRFIGLTDEDRGRLQQLIKTFAVLADEDDGATDGAAEDVDGDTDGDVQ